jgi:L-amino acid N-acyltransferase YncA
MTAPAVTAPANTAPVPAAPAQPLPARPYIRPVIKEDAEEILEIINYYNSSSPFEPEYEAMEPEDVYTFIKKCKLRQLPFLALVKPPDPSQTAQGPPKSQICGIAYVDLFEEGLTERAHGDLRVYTRPGMTRRGYGTLLMDCLLSLCDDHYRRRTQFEWRPVGDVQLQVRRLKELVCAITYPAQLEMKYLFTWQWMKNTFGFKKMGETRQDRAKYGYE